MQKNYFLALTAMLAGLLASCSPKVGSALSADQLSAPLPAGTPYAVVHLYRPSRVMGFAVGYKVHLNDSVVYQARNGSQAVVRRAQPGPLTFWAKTEAREELRLDLQPGREYYVRCTLGAGALVGRPVLRQVGVAEGAAAVASLPAATTPDKP